MAYFITDWHAHTDRLVNKYKCIYLSFPTICPSSSVGFFVPLSHSMLNPQTDRHSPAQLAAYTIILHVHVHVCAITSTCS